MPIYCWPVVSDVGPTLNRHWYNVSCLLDIKTDPELTTGNWNETVSRCWANVSAILPTSCRTCRNTARSICGQCGLYCSAGHREMTGVSRPVIAGYTIAVCPDARHIIINSNYSLRYHNSLRWSWLLLIWTPNIYHVHTHYKLGDQRVQFLIFLICIHHIFLYILLDLLFCTINSISEMAFIVKELLFV